MTLAQKIAVKQNRIQELAGQLLDHLPMTAADWPFLEWMMGEIHSGNWGTPWIVSFEYGGVGELFAAVTDKETLAEQMPRICQTVKIPQTISNPL